MSDELEAFIDKSIIRSSKKGYVPFDFLKMRKRWTTKGAIERLVPSGDLQTNFLKLRDLDMLDWTLEAAVLRFPELFSRQMQEAARFRLRQAGWTGDTPTE